ncbi:hypothetical protein EON80_22315 [bacterium]|nr:MAG: hypothetical protein EON80_22315 [bacterium]
MDLSTDESKALAKAVDELYLLSLPRSKKRGRRDLVVAHAREMLEKAIIEDLGHSGIDDSETDVWDVYIYDIYPPDPWFKRYLPWFLEQIALDGGFDFGTGLIFKKLSDADVREWPEFERQTIEDYVIAFWKNLLITPCGYASLEGAIECFSLVLDDVRPLLRIWEDYFESGSETSIRHILKLLEENWPEFNRDRIFDDNFIEKFPSLTPVQGALRTVREWVLDLKLRQVFEDISEHGQSEVCRELAFDIAYYLQRLKQ